MIISKGSKKVKAVRCGWDNEMGYMFYCNIDKNEEIKVSNSGDEISKISEELFKKWCKKYNYKLEKN